MICKKHTDTFQLPTELLPNLRRGPCLMARRSFTPTCVTNEQASNGKKENSKEDNTKRVLSRNRTQKKGSIIKQAWLNFRRLVGCGCQKHETDERIESKLTKATGCKTYQTRGSIAGGGLSSRLLRRRGCSSLFVGSCLGFDGGLSLVRG